MSLRSNPRHFRRTRDFVVATPVRVRVGNMTVSTVHVTGIEQVVKPAATAVAATDHAGAV